MAIVTKTRLLSLVVAATAALSPAVTRAAQSPWDPDQVELRTHELAPGVYAVLPADAFELDHVGTTGGFVIGERGVLVVESMLNGRLASQLLALIRRETALPVRFLVNTSYHGDHSYGNFVFPQETCIIQHPATEVYVEDHFEDDRAFMLDLMGSGKGIEEVVPRSADVIVPAQLAVDLGVRRVEILHLGFAQTAGDLVVWLPREKVAWVGNMIQAGPPALPWLLEGRHEETMATLKELRNFLPAGSLIVPGHGKPMERAEIDFSLGYLEELHRQVEEALDEGLSLEETVERVEMRNYGDYSLYPFAHRQVNVPAVYRDLQGTD